MDPTFVDPFHQVAPHIKHVAKHVHHVAPTVIPIVKQGHSMLSLIVSNISTAVIVGGLAWYIRGRGFAGVQIDINNIKTDIENLKAKISPAPAA